MCAMLERGGDFLEDLEDLMDEAGAPLSCPLRQTTMSVENYPFELPVLPAGFGLVVQVSFHGDHRALSLWERKPTTNHGTKGCWPLLNIVEWL